MTARCEFKACSNIDKLGHKSWDCSPLRLFKEALTNPAPGLGTSKFHKTKQTALRWNQSFCLLTDWWYWFASWDDKQEPWTAMLKPHPWSGQAAWDLYPVETPDVLCPGTSQGCSSLDVGQKPIWWLSGVALGITVKMEAQPQPPLFVPQARSWDEGVRPCDSDLFFPLLNWVDWEEY